MDYMSLKRFKEKYYPKLTQRALGRQMGISDKEFTWIKQQRANPTEECYKKCAGWMKYMHNVILTYDEPEWAAEQKYEELYGATIRAKDREIAKLKEQVRQLQTELCAKEQAAPILVELEKTIIAKHEKEKAEKRKKK